MTPSKRRTAVLVVSMLLGSYLPLPAQSPRAPDAELAAGIALVRDGDFETAVLKLDTVVRRLLADATRTKDAAQAYVYLGVAFLELGQEGVARGKFQQALALDPQVRLDAREFSPQQIRVFESARTEARAPASPVPASPRPRSTPTPAASPVATAQGAPPAEEKKKKKKSPVIWIVGGAAVVGAGVAAAGGGGGGGGAQPTTTTSPIANPTSTVPTLPPDTTTTTTQPGETPPPPTSTTTTTTPSGPTSTTVPPTTVPPTSTTTTSTTLPTTTTTTSSTTTTTTTLPACTYSISATSTPPAFALLGGSGFCTVTASNPSCNWSVGTSDTWINISNGSGSGTGPVNFTVDVALAARTGRITLFQGSQPTCTIQQTVLLDGDAPASRGALTFTSDLDLAGGQGQVVVDGSIATFQSRGSREGAIDPTRGVHRVEATVVSADGTPGTWRFRLTGPLAPDSLRVVAGTVVSAGAEDLAFRLSGKPGERVVFVFRVR